MIIFAIILNQLKKEDIIRILKIQIIFAKKLVVVMNVKGRIKGGINF